MQMQRQNLENWGTSVIVKGKTVGQAFSMAHPRIISVLALLLYLDLACELQADSSHNL
jgi:hypothetical protein